MNLFYKLSILMGLIVVLSNYLVQFPIQYFGLNEILTYSDYIILLLPLTNKTTEIINERSIKLLKNGAKLINAGRGGLIEEKSFHRLALMDLKGTRI